MLYFFNIILTKIKHFDIESHFNIVKNNNTSKMTNACVTYLRESKALQSTFVIRSVSTVFSFTLSGSLG